MSTRCYSWKLWFQKDGYVLSGWVLQNFPVCRVFSVRLLRCQRFLPSMLFIYHIATNTPKPKIFVFVFQRDRINSDLSSTECLVWGFFKIYKSKGCLKWLVRGSWSFLCGDIRWIMTYIFFSSSYSCSTSFRFSFNRVHFRDVYRLTYTVGASLLCIASLLLSWRPCIFAQRTFSFSIFD